jgi:hypothetical protein
MKVLVSSAMRTGSTWIYEILLELLRAERSGFVSQLGEVLAAAEAHGSFVLKSHSLIDLDALRLRGKVHTIRILRNIKDSLISRALYCRNVRPAQGLENEEAEEQIIQNCQGFEDQKFVNVFLAEAAVVKRWMEELTVFERGVFDQTFYYEMLLHNPRTQLYHWTVRHGFEKEIPLDALDRALEKWSFSNMRQNMAKGFIGSTGVGRWMEWLEAPVVKMLDAMYLEQMEIVRRHPDERRPVTRPGHRLQQPATKNA